MAIKKCWLQTDYPNVAYTTANGLPKGATVSSGGCGIISALNILYNYLGKTSIGISDMVSIARSSGARYNGGTDIGTLLAACKKKWGGFDYYKVDSDTQMKIALEKGYWCVAHTPGTTSLFSGSGHFVAFYGIDGKYVQVMDSYWYANKWTQNTNRKQNIKLTGTKGVVLAKYSAVCPACDYYYVVQKIDSKKTSKVSPTFEIGKQYVLAVNLKLREDPSIDSEIKNKEDVETSRSYMVNGTKKAIIKKGTTIRVKKIETNDGGTFIKSSSGWLLAWNAKTKRVNIQ